MSRRLAAGTILLLAVLAGMTPVPAQVPDWPSERPPKPLPARDVKFPPYAIKTLPNGLQVIAVSHHEQPSVSIRLMVRAGGAQMFSEFVATFGLLAVIWGCARLRAPAVPFAVGAYITAAYWFTASTSFANPAVTLARAASDTFAGIRPSDVPGFIMAQLLGADAVVLEGLELLADLGE